MIGKWVNRKEDGINVVDEERKVKMYVNGEEFVISIKLVREVV